MKQFLAVVEPRESWLPLTQAQRRRVLRSGIAGVSVRIGRPDALVVVRDAVDAGLAWRTHRWEGEYDERRQVATVDVADAERAALSAVSQIEAIERAVGVACESHEPNPERDWWRGNPGAVDALDRYVSVFYDGLRTAHLDYLGFIDPSWHYGKRDFDGDGDVDTEVPDWLQGRFRKPQVMAYQGSYEDLLFTLRRARAAWPDHELGAYCAIGALREDGSVIGDWHAWERIIGEGHIAELTHYLGMGKTRVAQLLEGHARHPSIVDLVPVYARAARRRELS